MAIVKTKVPDFTGHRATVYFKNGVGSTEDPVLLNWFKTHGYIVETEAEVKSEVTKPVVEEPIKRKVKTKAN